MAADLLLWLLRSALGLGLAIAVVMALRPLWRSWLGATSVLWLWLLLPAALVATSVPRPVVVIEEARAVGNDPARASPAANHGRSAMLVDAVARDDAGTQPAAPPRLLARTADATTVWGTPLLLAWLAGALAMAMGLIRQQRRFRRRLGTLRPRPDGSYMASTAQAGPAVIGAFRPRIVVPADFERRYDPQQRALVLAHERCHLRRGDLQVSLALCAMRCVFWFNPLVHLASTRLRLDQELACDAVVLRQHPDAGRAYASALLNTQLADLGLPVGCHWQSSHPLKWRIAMLKRPLPGSARLVLGAGLALLASSAAATTLWSARPVATIVLPASAAPLVALTPLPEPLAPLAAVEPALPAPLAALAATAAMAPLPATPAARTTLPEPVTPVTPSTMPTPVTPVAPSTTATPVTPATPATMPTPATSSMPEGVPAPRATPTPAASPAPAAPIAADAATSAPTAVPSPVAAQAPVVRQIWLADPPRDRDRKRESRATVMVQVDVDSRGKPGNAVVVHNDLGDQYAVEALRAIRRWLFDPALREGQAVASTIMVSVPFDMGAESGVDGFWVQSVELPPVVQYDTGRSEMRRAGGG